MKNWTTSMVALGALAVFCAGNCFAKLGESKEDIDQRYGKSTETLSTGGETYWQYTVGQFETYVIFVDGKSVFEMLMPKDDTRKLNDEECIALISAISGATNWHKAASEQPLYTEWTSGTEFKGVRLDSATKTKNLAVTTKAYYALMRSRETSKMTAPFGGPVPTNAPAKAAEKSGASGSTSPPPLGATEAEVEKYYGKSTGSASRRGVQVESYESKRFDIELSFKDGKSASELFRPKADDKLLNDVECEVLMNAASPSDTWMKRPSSTGQKTVWQSAHGNFAMRKNGPQKTEYLLIGTPEVLKTAGEQTDGGAAATNELKEKPDQPKEK